MILVAVREFALVFLDTAVVAAMAVFMVALASVT